MASAYLTLAADLTDFRPDLGLTASAGQPMLEQADRHLLELEGEIEATARRRGYVVPITGARSLAVLSLGLKWAMTSYVLRARGYAPPIGDETSDAVLGERRWEELLRGIAEVPGYLPDAAIDTGGDELPVRKGVSGLAVADSTAIDERQFTRGMRV